MGRKKRVERFRVTEFRNASGTRSWRISGTKIDGERVRENFGEREDAFGRRAELETESAEGERKEMLRKTTLSAEQLSDAEAAFLNSSDKSIASIVSEYRQFETRAQAKGVTLGDAVRFFESHYRPEHKEISILQARDKFLSSRKGLRPRTLVHYDYSTRNLLKPDPNRLVHKFAVSDVEEVLRRFTNPNTVRTYRRGITTFFAWAVRHHHCLENPCDRLDRALEDTTPISILNLDEVKRLLTAAMRYADGVMTPCIAVALFAGLRPSEIEEMEPSDVLADRIRVRGGKRRKVKRAVPIPRNLKTWLKQFPLQGRPSGWERKMRNLKTATKANRWVKDILRHTSISFQTERDSNEGLTVFNNGTSKAMMDRHYRDVIGDPKVVAAFWSLTPEAVVKENLEVTLPARKLIGWPSDERLAKLVQERPLTRIAKDLNASDVAVRKHCIRRNIILPSRLMKAAA